MYYDNYFTGISSQPCYTRRIMNDIESLHRHHSVEHLLSSIFCILEHRTMQYAFSFTYHTLDNIYV